MSLCIFSCSPFCFCIPLSLLSSCRRCQVTFFASFSRLDLVCALSRLDGSPPFCSALSSCVFFHAPPPLLRLSFFACVLPLFGAVLCVLSFCARCSASAPLLLHLSFFAVCCRCSALFFVSDFWLLSAVCPVRTVARRLGLALRRFYLFCPFCLRFFLFLAWMSFSALISFLPALRARSSMP